MENIKKHVDKLMADETVTPTDKKDLLIGWISQMYDKILTTPMDSHDLCEANMCVEYMRSLINKTNQNGNQN